MLNAIWQFLSTEGFQPHGMCLLWRSDVFWTHLISDGVIALSYFSIPIAIVYFALRRPDLRYGWLLHMFGAFIVACGVSHLFGMWTMFVPDYGAQAVVKAGTAIISLTTAVALWPLMPRLLSMPSPSQLEERNAQLAREIDERRTAERKLRELNEALERRVTERTASLVESNDQLRSARARAERYAEARADFLASMSHEIRTPMNGVVGMLELLKLGDLPPEQARYVTIAQESAGGLLSVINDILDFSRLESGAVSLDEAAFRPREVFESAVALLEAGARDKGLEVELELAPDLPDAVEGDPARLRQILFNLVGNAIKFTDRGSVRIGVDHRRDDDGGIVLDVTVRDTGIGISAEAQARIFDRFAQADGATGRKYGGTGLGLAITRQVVELMGGRIGVESAPGEGSLFWFSIRCAPAATTIPEESRQDELHALWRAHPARILAVEDNSVNQLLMTKLLARFGHAVDVVGGGAEALEALETGDYDLVLMDINLPGMDGVTAARSIRKLRTAVARIPIVALTANAMPGDRESYIAAGMTDYVSKPIDPAALFEAIRRALRKGFADNRRTA